MAGLVAAVDVGTGSARAGLFDARGRLLARAEHPIEMNRPRPGHAEQDSEQIWAGVCAAVRAAHAEAGAAPGDVVGISFDATCSLVVRAPDGAQVGVSEAGGDRWDTVAWLDHRAEAEAAECTASGHRVLDHLGGVMSPEMQIPKLMWLKRRLPAAWARAGLMFDLADFLTWRASGATARSQCTLTCKWGYLAHEPQGWPQAFLAAMGLADLPARAALPAAATPVATDLGPLTATAARELGLAPGVRVAAGLIDAHAGALGVLGRFAGDADALARNPALIAGTSSCVMAFSRDPRPTPGIWGPFLGVALPDMWMTEGGQSASGGLLDHVCRVWGGGAEPSAELHSRICTRIAALRAAEGWDLGGRLHVLPDFHGNRSPLADPAALGVMSGLTLDASFDGLCKVYWRTAVGTALGLRHILERMDATGERFDTLHLTGGLTRSPLMTALISDATGRRVSTPKAPDAVLLGAAMVAATGAGLHHDLAAAGRAMHQGDTLRAPDPAAADRMARDYRVFLEMHRQRRRLEALADGAT